MPMSVESECAGVDLVSKKSTLSEMALCRTTKRWRQAKSLAQQDLPSQASGRVCVTILGPWTVAGFLVGAMVAFSQLDAKPRRNRHGMVIRVIRGRAITALRSGLGNELTNDSVADQAVDLGD
jgi:hypothetical protein